MATQHNSAAVPRRDARIGGALDAETRQQAAEVNRCVIDALAELLAADPRLPRPVPSAAGGRRGRPPQGAPAPQRPAAPPPAAHRPDPSSPAGPQSPSAGGSPGCGPPASWSPAARDALSAVPGGALLEVGPAWIALDDPARAALASCPYLLVELDVPRLLASAVANGRVSDAAAARGPAGWPAPWCDVARMVFQFAWHLARVSPVLSGFVLGLRARDVDALRAIGLSRADALVPGVAPFVALRWGHDASLWSDWLAAARAGDRAALRACELRGLQRLAGGCRAAGVLP